MTTPRYAIYFAPEPGTPLAVFGRSWLGRDHAGDVPESRFAIPGVTPRRLSKFTEGPRHYGMHCTLKPPFRLRDTCTEQGLLATAKLVAKGLAPIEIPPLELDVVGRFIAMTPSTQSVALEQLAATCVRTFEAFRQPLTTEQEKHYQLSRLTVHQEQMLEHWGYPYVMEEFGFHITLTEPLPDDRERNEVMEALREFAAPVLGRPIPLRQICVFRETDPAEPMSILARFPFGRTD